MKESQDPCPDYPEEIYVGIGDYWVKAYKQYGSNHGPGDKCSVCGESIFTKSGDCVKHVEAG